jgi:predicted DNA-binding helix-hairpin-helix protein
VDLIRRKYQYHGYIHLKIMPSAEAAQIEQAARLADRLSINLEGANEERLSLLAPKKDFWQELLPPLYWLRQNQPHLEPWVKRPSLTTQFVVGPAGESDRELLTTAHLLYREANLARAYYSPFNPIRGTVLENAPKTPPLREHRLYQADWLLRFYGFQVDQLPFDEQGHLPLTSIKIGVGQGSFEPAPHRINRASRTELCVSYGPKLQAIHTAKIV